MLRIESNRSFLVENPEGKSQRKILRNVHQSLVALMVSNYYMSIFFMILIKTGWCPHKLILL